MTDSPAPLQPRLRLKAGETVALGPGKAQLLEKIQQHRSISAAARAMNMSYRRAWLLVDTMNACFRQPLVETSTGGSQGGGAQLTEDGLSILALYREYEQAVNECPQRQKLEHFLKAGTSSDT